MNIDSITLDLIADMIGEPFEYSDEPTAVLTILAEVRGALYMADEFKKALREVEK